MRISSSLTARNYFFVAALCLFFFALFTALNLVVRANSVTNVAKENPLLLINPQDAKRKYDVEGSAYVFLSLGAQGNSLTCSAAIESLVRYSGWGGHVYLITDRPACSDAEEIIRNSRINPSKFHIHVINEEFGGGGYDKHNNIGFRMARFRSLSVKARLFEEIVDPNIHTLAFADCDIIFGVEGCTADFISKHPLSSDGFNFKATRLTYRKDGKKSESFFYEPGLWDYDISQEMATKKGIHHIVDIHLGTFVVHRDHSKEVLRLWRDELESLKYVSCLLY